MKKKSLLLSCLLLSACASWTPAQKTIAEQTAMNVASIGVRAAATYYGGAVAGEMASDGFSAIASVAQSYLGQTIPANVVTASPGVAGVGPAIATLIPSSHVITQSDVNKLNAAASLATTAFTPAS